MSSHRNVERREPGWRALVLAGAVAGGVLLLLAASVGIVWLVGRSSSAVPAIGAQPPPTPTPRALSFAPETQPSTELGAIPTLVPEEGSVQPTNQAATSATPTPGLMILPESEESGVMSNGAMFSAPGSAPFPTLARGSWVASADTLRNDGTAADAEPLLSLASSPTTSFAIEAEIRVNGALDSFCDQSFGLAGGNPTSLKMYGGGILFPCDGNGARARLTDVSVWEDGYHADPLIAENAFDPGEDWRTYRFELRGGSVRLIVDGVGVVSGMLDPPIDPAVAAEAGLWSQGVDLEVRRIDVFPLPPS